MNLNELPDRHDLLRWAMNLLHAQREIDSIRSAIEKAQDSGMLPSHDPTLIELERIMLERIEELEEAKAEAGDVPRFGNLLFADIEDVHEERIASNLGPRRIR